MSQKGKDKKPKKVKYSHKDVEKEWQEVVADRAVEQGVSEDEVIRWGIHHNFKKAKKDEENQEKRLSLLREIRDSLKKGGDKP